MRVILKMATTREEPTAMGTVVLPAEKFMEYKGCDEPDFTLAEKGFIRIHCNVTATRKNAKDVYLPISPLAILEVLEDDEKTTNEEHVIATDGTPKAQEIEIDG